MLPETLVAPAPCLCKTLSHIRPNSMPSIRTDDSPLTLSGAATIPSKVLWNDSYTPPTYTGITSTGNATNSQRLTKPQVRMNGITIRGLTNVRLLSCSAYAEYFKHILEPAKCCSRSPSSAISWHFRRGSCAAMHDYKQCSSASLRVA